MLDVLAGPLGITIVSLFLKVPILPRSRENFFQRIKKTIVKSPAHSSTEVSNYNRSMLA